MTNGESVKDMTSKFDKLEKFEGQDFRRWQKKMHFLLTTLKVMYVLSTPSPVKLLRCKYKSITYKHIEKVVQDALERMMVGQTSVVVAHRLSTIQGCDTIMVREKEKVTEKRNPRCGDPNHLIGECLNPPKNNDQRAFIGGAWSNNGEDEVEKTEDETCLVAQAPDEICLGINLEPDEWIKDSGCSKHMTDYLTKFDPKSYEGVFLGYSQNSKAYIILNKQTMKVEESLNVTFDETPPPPKTSPLEDDELVEEEAIEDYGILRDHIETIVYADSDHAGDYIDRKSTSGVCTFMGCCLTSWFSKKQTALAISTTKAEYVSSEKACQQAIWMKQALVDYGVRLDDIPIMCDNKGAIDLSKNPVQHSRTKHIEIRHHFLRDNIQKGNISIEKVSSEDNIADILTKPLKREPFNYLRLAREDKPSAGNRSVVNKLESELAQDVGSLCKMVAASAITDLKNKVSASKNLYISYIEDMENIIRLHKATTNGRLDDLKSLASSDARCVKEGTLSTQQDEIAVFARELRKTTPIHLVFIVVNIDLELVLEWSSSVFSSRHSRSRHSLLRRLYQYEVPSQQIDYLSYGGVDIPLPFNKELLFIGVSGAGKTTLMDVLAGRKTGGYTEGNIFIFGYPKNQSTFAHVSGYLLIVAKCKQSSRNVRHSRKSSQRKWSRCILHIRKWVLIRKLGYDIRIGAGLESMTANPMALDDRSVNLRVKTMAQDQDFLLPMRVNSHRKAAVATTSVLFGEKIVDPKTREETPVRISVDDGIRPGTTLADLAKLKPIFKKDGSTTTARNNRYAANARINTETCAKAIQPVKFVLELRICGHYPVVAHRTVEVGTETAAILKVQTEQMGRIVNDLDTIHFSVKKALRLVNEIG
ncbi:copia protein [Tanacetum coccineum]|uniref:Copia protein n=1 Tax=Tanacetum coccineum TaxID=301880 RepID=A0ABQ5AMP0_9ASTR